MNINGALVQVYYANITYIVHLYQLISVAYLLGQGRSASGKWHNANPSKESKHIDYYSQYCHTDNLSIV